MLPPADDSIRKFFNAPTTCVKGAIVRGVVKLAIAPLKLNDILPELGFITPFVEIIDTPDIVIASLSTTPLIPKVIIIVVVEIEEIVGATLISFPVLDTVTPEVLNSQPLGAVNVI